MPEDHLLIGLHVVLSVCPSMPTKRSNSTSLKLALKMTDGYSGIAGKLSTVCISQFHMCSGVVGLHQLPWTVMRRELFLDIVVQMEEITLQVPLTILSAHTHTPLVRLVAKASNLSGLSEPLLKWLLSGSFLLKSISCL